MNNRKEVIFDSIPTEGATISDLSRRTKMSKITIRFYVASLESEGKVIIQKVGKYKLVKKNGRFRTKKEQ